MKIIDIRRDNNGKVTFDEVSIDSTENVCFRNLDPQQAHWPDVASNQVGAFESANSSECIITPPAGQTRFTYKCQLHDGEVGVINVFPPLASAIAPTQAVPTPTLTPATRGTPITEQQVVKGGKPPYTVNLQLFQVTDGAGNVLQSGSGVGPGLKLNNPPAGGRPGITVSGTPTVSGTYAFALDVDDSMERNLQQQFKMVVT